jgi:tetratricopeptide (TPR) repeat protein
MADRLSDLVAAISDGHEIDWAAADRITDPRRRGVRSLRALAAVVSAHHTIQPLRDRTAAPQDSAAVSHAPLGVWGSYLLLDHLGTGTSADVFRAYDPKLDRYFALKLLTPFHSGRGRGDAIIEEARNLARIRHPSVAAVYTADRIDGRVGIAMELVDGDSIEQLLSENGVFGVPETVQIGIQLCEALSAVHLAGLIHRDIKAQNVVRDRGGRIVLMDFGTAIDHADASGHVLAGTPAYSPPEVFRAESASARSDIYSGGVLLFRMLTGVFPVEGATIGELRRAHRAGRSRRVRDVRAEIPPAVAAVIDRALEPRVEDRFRTAEEMRQALARAVAARGASRKRVATLPVPIVSVAAVLLLAAAGAVWFVSSRSERTPVAATANRRVAFGPTDGVLVAQFEDGTGNGALGAAVTYALERELERGGSFEVISRERIEDALKLMKKPIDAVVDERVAREVSLRDGGVRVILAGRVDPRGAAYVIGARLVDPPSGHVFGTAEVESPSHEEIVAATRTLAEQVRSVLGAAPPPTSQASLQRATTSSLEALRLYSESYQLGKRGQWRGALELARAAVHEDPKFATAQVWLAWALRRSGAARDEYVRVARRAFELAGNIEESERLWIAGSYYDMNGDDTRAEGIYQALLQLDPDHPWGLNNLSLILTRQHRERELLPYHLAAADRRPNDLRSSFEAAHSLAYLTGDFERARPYVGRVRQLQSAEYPDQLAWAYYFDAAERLARRDIPGVEREVARVFQQLPETPEWLREFLVGTAVRYYLTLGQARQALDLLNRFTDRDLNYPMYGALIAFTVNDHETARQHLRRVPFVRQWSFIAAWLMARVGMADFAERWITGRPIPHENASYVVDGVVRLARGDAGGAARKVDQ